MKPATVKLIKEMCHDLIEKTNDKIAWGIIYHNFRQRRNVQHFLIYKFMQIIQKGKISKVHWDKISGFDHIAIKEDCAIFLRSWSKMCQRMDWPYYPNDHPVYDTTLDKTVILIP